MFRQHEPLVSTSLCHEPRQAGGYSLPSVSSASPPRAEQFLSQAHHSLPGSPRLRIKAPQGGRALEKMDFMPSPNLGKKHVPIMQKNRFDTSCFPLTARVRGNPAGSAPRASHLPSVRASLGARCCCWDPGLKAGSCSGPQPASPCSPRTTAATLCGSRAPCPPKISCCHP